MFYGASPDLFYKAKRLRENMTLFRRENYCSQIINFLMKSVYRKNLMFLFSFYSIVVQVKCQGLNNIFMYGYMDSARGYINFDSGFPVAFNDSLRTINMNISNANISDLSVNLFFYSNVVISCDASITNRSNGNAFIQIV